MASDPYFQALDDLTEAIRVHRITYAASERGLFTWHAACEETWKAVLGYVRVAGFVSGAGIEMPVVVFAEPDDASPQ